MILDKDRKEDKDKVGIASVPPPVLPEDGVTWVTAGIGVLPNWMSLFWH